MKRKKKRKMPKERNFLVPIMRLHCKDGPHLDKKKEADRKACRVRLRPGVDGLPVFFCWDMIPGCGFSSSGTRICSS
jgi:hypothetical protein